MRKNMTRTMRRAMMMRYVPPLPASSSVSAGAVSAFAGQQLGKLVAPRRVCLCRPAAWQACCAAPCLDVGLACSNSNIRTYVRKTVPPLPASSLKLAAPRRVCLCRPAAWQACCAPCLDLLACSNSNIRTYVRVPPLPASSLLRRAVSAFARAVSRSNRHIRTLVKGGAPCV